MGRSDGLDALAQRVRFDLACLNHPPANWVVPATHPSGDPVNDVVVIGAGMAGLVLIFSLLRNGIRNIRCLDRGLAGPIHAPASAFCKHPPRQLPDDEAFVELERFIRGS